MAFSLCTLDEENVRLGPCHRSSRRHSLYWRKEGDRLLFASRVGAIRSTQEHQRLLIGRARAVHALQRRSRADGNLSGHRKTSPGDCLVYEASKIQQTRYWDLQYRKSDNHDVAHWAREVREGMRSGGPSSAHDLALEKTGAYLSGGTDSSSVVAFMNECHSPVNTYSIFFAEVVYSEIGFARTTAEHFRANHHELSLTSRDTYDAIRRSWSTTTNHSRTLPPSGPTTAPAWRANRV